MKLLYDYIVKNKLNHINSLNISRKVFYSITSKQKKILQECYETLGIAENSNQEEIRRAYLALVKLYHPDNVNGDIKKFQEIDKAFRTINEYKCNDTWNVDKLVVRSHTMEEFDIKHTAPQHRQYLSYDGFGSGTIFQREKQYAKVRALQAAENIMQHRIAKVTADDKALLDKAPLKHKIKTRYGFDRLVEDLIQESMSKGEFSNLKGTGKPLKNLQAANPYVDFVTHKLNQILIENGFTPEWIMLQKEIREEIEQLKHRLNIQRGFLRKWPLDINETFKWNETVAKEIDFTAKLNKKIEKYNLLVPMLNKQFVSLNLSKITEKILKHGKYGIKREQIEDRKENSSSQDEGIFGIIAILLKK